MEAYQKLNQGNNKLFYYLTKTPVKRDKQELKVNDDTNEYQWNNSLKIEYIETLNIELPISTEIDWEIFSDEGYSDKGSMKISKDSLVERFLSFKINPEKDGNNFFINLKYLVMESTTNTANPTNTTNTTNTFDTLQDKYHPISLNENKKYDNYNCFISLSKLKELNNNLETSA